MKDEFDRQKFRAAVKKAARKVEGEVEIGRVREEQYEARLKSLTRRYLRRGRALDD